jgi:hypothetical protein
MNNVALIFSDNIYTTIAQGFSFTERKDEDYYSASLTLYLRDQEKSFQAGTDCVLRINNERINFTVESDSVTIVARNPIMYAHALELKERTIKLSKYINDNVYFSNQDQSKRTLRNYTDRLKNIYPLEKKNLLESTRILKFDENNEIMDTILPEMKLSNGTLFDQINTIYTYIDSFPRWKDTITADVFNTRRNLITKQDNLIQYSNSFNLDSAISQLHQYQTAALPSIENVSPSDYGFITSRSESVNFSTDSATLTTDFPIEKILKVEVYLPVNRNDALNYSVNIYKLENENYYMYNINYADTTNEIAPLSINNVYPAINNAYNIKCIKSDNNFNFSSYFMTLDITSSVMLKDKWSTLNLSADPFQKEDYRNNTLYYEVGSNKIYGLDNTRSYTNGVFTKTYYLIDELINKYNNTIDPEVYLVNKTSEQDDLKYGFNVSNNYSFDSGIAIDLTNVMFRITYIPQINPHVKLAKNNKRYDMVTVQSTDKIELVKQGKALNSLLKRLNHPLNVKNRIFRSFDDVNHVGDYLEDNYIITAIQHFIYNDYVMSVEEYSKNFNRTNNYAGIDQKTRTYNVIIDDYCNRDLNYAEYIIIAKRKYIDNNGGSNYFDNIYGKSLLLSSFNNKQYDFTIQGVEIKTYDSSGNSLISGYSEEENKSLFLPIVKSEFSNSFLFYFKFADITNAGDQKIKEPDSTYKTMNPVIYTDDNGEVYSIAFSFIAVNPNVEYEYVEKIPKQYMTTFKDTSVYYGYNEDEFSNEYSGEKYYLTPDGLYLKTMCKIKDLYVDKDYGYFETNIKVSETDLLNNSLLPVNDTSVIKYLPNSKKYDYYPEFIDNSSNSYNHISNECDFNTSLVVLKDSQEILSLTYQLQMIADGIDIIIGDFFIKYNHLINTQTPLYYLYYGGAKYSVSDTKMVHGIKEEIDGVKMYKYEIDYENCSITFTKQLANKLPSTFAFADENKNLILAINLSEAEQNQDSITIYFNFLNKIPQEVIEKGE